MKKIGVIFLSIISAGAFGQNQQAMHILHYDENFQVYGGKNGSCDAAREVYKKAEARTARYEAEVEEYKKGLFCSDCHRTASRIERELHISFNVHIDNGKAHGRNSERATKEMYSDLYKEYKSDWNPLKKQFDHNIDECVNGNIKAAKENEEERTQTTKTFNSGYRTAESNLSGLKNNSSKTGTQLNLQYATQLSNLKADFQTELNKGSKADISKLKQLSSSVDNLNSKIGDAARSSQTVASTNQTNDGKKSNDTKQASNAQAIQDKNDQESASKAATAKRVAASLEQSDRANKAMGGAALGVIGAAALLNDHYTDNATIGKFYLGLGWEQIPLCANDESHNSSSTEASSHPVILVGFRFGIFENKPISFELEPFGTYGLNVLESGTNGSHLSYGVSGRLFLGLKPDSRYKLFGELGYVKRSGNWSSDYDASAASIGIVTNSNIVRSGDYNYSVIRMGGGILIRYTENEETYFKPGLFFEKSSFSNSNTKPVLVANLQMLFSSFIMLDLSYSKNYFVAGKVNYSNKFDKSNQDFFSIRIIKTGKLF